MRFIKWLYENQNSDGNYVGIKSDNLSDLLKNLDIPEPKTGDKPPNGDYHCTLMYSESTSVDAKHVLDTVLSQFKNQYAARVISASCFDSLPEKGSRDKAKSCVVLELYCPPLNNINKFLAAACGLKHSYAIYSPHITLYYNMDLQEAHSLRDKLNSHISKSEYYVDLYSIYSQKLNKDYI